VLESNFEACLESLGFMLEKVRNDHGLGRKLNRRRTVVASQCRRSRVATGMLQRLRLSIPTDRVLTAANVI